MGGGLNNPPSRLLHLCQPLNTHLHPSLSVAVVVVERHVDVVVVVVGRRAEKMELCSVL